MILKTKKYKELLNYIFILLITTSSLLAQETQNISTLQGKELHTNLRFQFIPVKMPTNIFPNLKNTMGVLGVHYQIPISSSFYGGVTICTAITGDQGGLFTLGTEIGYQKKVINNLFIDTNFHFGGGGGYRYLVNDGAFINPNIGLKYKYNKISFGLQFSHYNFYTGKIKSNSLSFFIDIPNLIRYTKYTNSQKKYIANNINLANFWSTPAIKNSQTVRFNFLFPIRKSKKDNLQPLKNTLYVLGFEYQKYLRKNTFAFVHSGAIYKGLRAGYMDLFFGLGYIPYQNKYFNFFTKLSIGAAGGRIAPEGGLTIYPSTGVDIKLTKSFAINANMGYYKAIKGDFEAYALGFGIKYFGLNGGAQTPFTKQSKFTHFRTQGMHVNFQNQTYLNAQKTDAPFVIDLQMIGMQFNVDFNHTFYFIGEAGFAYGGKSGGYAHGLAGIGMSSSSFFNKKMKIHLEGVIGVAGGAGVDTGAGIVIRPTLGFSYKITQGIAIFASAGKMKALYGSFYTTNINTGLRFSLATLSVVK